MKKLFFFIGVTCLSFSPITHERQKVFDVHIHGCKDIADQLTTLELAGVYRAAISTSWDLQNTYRTQSNINLLFGLMFPCPNGKVPYSLQPCYGDGRDLPALNWVERQINEGKIDFLGEILSQYYGISSSDTSLHPYYKLAEKYGIPVGIHTGGAGSNHGSPNFRMELGDPLLVDQLLSLFPKLKIWIMHSGDQYYNETISVMQKSKLVYTDISVISNSEIVPSERFSNIIKSFIEAGLEDCLMFGTDNGDIDKVITAVKGLGFLSKEQKDKIFYQNAERFFASTEISK